MAPASQALAKHIEIWIGSHNLILLMAANCMGHLLIGGGLQRKWLQVRQAGNQRPARLHSKFKSRIERSGPTAIASKFDGLESSMSRPSNWKASKQASERVI